MGNEILEAKKKIIRGRVETGYKKTKYAMGDGNFSILEKIDRLR